MDRFLARRRVGLVRQVAGWAGHARRAGEAPYPADFPQQPINSLPTHGISRPFFRPRAATRDLDAVPGLEVGVR